MSGRRSHVRFAVLQSPQGMLRVLQDVVIQDIRSGCTVALSREPGVVGELVSVQFPQDDSDIRAKVLESHPVVIDGNVRHQLRLSHMTEASAESPSDDVMDGGVTQ
jgi:hypothetical protein